MSPQPQSEPSAPPTAPATPQLPHRELPTEQLLRDRVSQRESRSRSPADRVGLGQASASQRPATAQPGTPVGGEHVFPYPFSAMPRSMNHYVEFHAERKEGEGASKKPFFVAEANAEMNATFFVEEAIAEFEDTLCYFTLKKIPADAEINIDKLSEPARNLFTGPQGARAKEWQNMISAGKDSESGPAVRVHRGARARELRKNYAHRMIPTRFLDKWKDMGDDYETPLSPKDIEEAQIPAHHDAKSRWIIQGFHDPDITILNRSVPTPETSDVPLCLQVLASIKAKAFVGDVKGAFTQGLRGQRQALGMEPLFALPPPGGIPGEPDDIVIEILAEIYGLITGPPGWRRSLFTTFKNLGFKAHPLAPCVVLYYENIAGVDLTLSGLICVETDDLLGGGRADASKFHSAIDQLRKQYTFGKWKILQDGSTEYGGRTLSQLKDFDFKISMTRYLREKAVEIKLVRGRGKDPKGTRRRRRNHSNAWLNRQA